MPFAKSLITAAILAYILYPIYNFLLSKLKSKNLTASIMLILTLLLIIIPMFLIINGIIGESLGVYSSIKGNMSQSVVINKLSNIKLPEKLGNFDFKIVTTQTASKVENLLIGIISKLILSLPNMLFNLFIVLFSLFFFFRDGDKILDFTRNLLEINVKHRRFLEREVSSMTYSIIYGNFMAALAQAILATIGYFIFQVKSPLLWGLATFFIAMIPLIGSSIIWGPLAILKLIEGYFTQSWLLIFQGVSLLLWGAFAVGTIDNIVRPKFAGEKSRIHPLIILITMIGGIKIFGFIGIIAGPIIYALAAGITKLYFKYGTELLTKRRKNENQKIRD